MKEFTRRGLRLLRGLLIFAVIYLPVYVAIWIFSPPETVAWIISNVGFAIAGLSALIATLPLATPKAADTDGNNDDSSQLPPPGRAVIAGTKRLFKFASENWLAFSALTIIATAFIATFFAFGYLSTFDWRLTSNLALSVTSI
jgi:hypothetical protein